MNKNKLFVFITFLLFISVSFPQPLPITDLTATSTDKIDEIKLEFTYPGPGVLPDESVYYVQHSTYLEGVIWSTANANVIISTSNVSQEEQQVIVITNLEGNNTYYFHIWVSSGTEQLLSEISNRATYYLQGEVIMEIQKSYTATTKRPGDEITYIITYKNVGNIKTSWFKIEDKIPSYTVYKSSSITVNDEQKTDDKDEETGPDAEFNNDRIIVIFDDPESQILPQQTGNVKFKVIVK